MAEHIACRREMDLRIIAFFIKMNISGLKDFFNEDRILTGRVSEKERILLEDRLLKMYLCRARREGKEVVVLTDKEEYDNLNREKRFNSEFYILTDEKGTVSDMRSIVMSLLETTTGNFYAKLITSYA